MNERVGSRQEGQSLVLVAVAMVVLLGFAALAIDGGHLYAERRRMQNAADAGALAGAHEICFGSWANAEAVARDYAMVRNGAEEADVTVQPWQVDVVARENVELFLAGIVGVPAIEVTAEAAAVCTGASMACGIWPIGFAEDRWVNECGAGYFLWMSDTEEAPTCGEYNCDVYCDGRQIFEGPLTEHVWLDFTGVLLDDGVPEPCDQPGVGANELRWRVWGCQDNQWDPPCPPELQCRSAVNIPSCVQGASGVKASDYQAAEDMVGAIVRFPLYSEVGCTIEGPGNPSDTYWVSTLGCARVLGITRLCELDEQCVSWEDGGCRGNGPRVILVEIPCVDGESDPACSSECGRAGNAPPQPGEVRAVSLIR